MAVETRLFIAIFHRKIHLISSNMYLLNVETLVTKYMNLSLKKIAKNRFFIGFTSISNPFSRDCRMCQRATNFSPAKTQTSFAKFIVNILLYPRTYIYARARALSHTSTPVPVLAIRASSLFFLFVFFRFFVFIYLSLSF